MNEDSKSSVEGLLGHNNEAPAREAEEYPPAHEGEEGQDLVYYDEDMDDSEQAPKQLSRDEIRLIIDSIPPYKFFDATDAE